MLHVFGAATPGADRALRPRLHGAPARRALAGRRRGLRARPRLPPGRGSRALRRRRATDLGARARGRRAARAAGVRGRRGRARLLDEGAPLVGTLRGRARFAVAGYVGGGRANADAIAAAGLRRARRAAEGEQGAPRVRETLVAGGTAGDGDAPRPRSSTCRRVARESGSSFYAGMRLLPRRQARRALRDLRARAADRRHRRRRPAAPTRSSPRLERDARRARRASTRATTRCSSRSPTPRAATRSRSTRSASSSTAPRWTCAAPSTRRSPTSSTTAAASRARSAGSRSASSTAPTARAGERARRRPRRRAPAREHPARPRRGRPRPAASTCRARTSSASAARSPTGASRARSSCVVAFEAQRALERLDRGLALVPLLDRRSAVVRARDDRQVRPAARADRRRPAARAARAGCRCARWEKGLVLARSLVAGRGVTGARSRSSAAGSRGSPPRSSAPTRARRSRSTRARTRLGGATFSVERDGRWLDNGQHIALRCCTAYLGFLDAARRRRPRAVQPRLRVPVLREGKPPAFIARNGMPAPLHLGPSLPALSAARACASASRRSARGARAAQARSRRPRARRADVRRLAARARPVAPPRSTALWNLIALPTLNLHADEASLARRVQGLPHRPARRADAADIGVSTVPLQRLHGDAATAALERAGARFVLGTPVRARRSRRPARLQLDDGSDEADAVVVAVPHQAAAQARPAGRRRRGRARARSARARS